MRRPARRSRRRGGARGTNPPVPATCRPSMETVPASGVSKPAISRSRVVLPQPGRADDRGDGARGQRQVDVVEHRWPPNDFARPATSRASRSLTARPPWSTAGTAPASPAPRARRAAARTARPPRSRVRCCSDQNRIASVLVPVGASSSVAVNSVATRRTPARHLRRRRVRSAAASPGGTSRSARRRATRDASSRPRRHLRQPRPQVHHRAGQEHQHVGGQHQRHRLVQRRERSGSRR